tara:strand:- start:635 stop:1264 length:630 start_codon:yes stop_codon:yes gene_type:complete
MQKKFLKLFSTIFFISFIFLNKIYSSEKNYINDINPFNEDGTVNAFIEIPAGSNEKWEVSRDGKDFSQKVNKDGPRVIDYLPYPFNYGFIPQTLIPLKEGGDGDALDIIVIGPNLKRGSVVKAKPIGAVEMLDKGEIDTKIISLSINDLGISYSNSIDDLNRDYIGVMEIIKVWLENYKGSEVKILNISGKNRALEYIKTFHSKFLSQK